jgi:YfiH family protein
LFKKSGGQQEVGQSAAYLIILRKLIEKGVTSMMEPFSQADPTYMEITKWKEWDHNLVVGISTRNEGSSVIPYSSLNLGLHVGDHRGTVVSNRKRLGERIDFSVANWVCGEQVHGSNIVKVGKEHSGKGVLNYESSLPNVDGFYTCETDLLLTACYADCVPLYFFAPNHGVIGIAHAGWKGTVEGIGPSMIKKWIEEERISPGEIFAVIGPAIGLCCYEVDDRVIAKVVQQLQPDSKYPHPYIKTGANSYQLDLNELNRQLLVDAGVKDEHIERSGFCTSCRTDLFFSHRKENGKTGRMISFIGRKKVG